MEVTGYALWREGGSNLEGHTRTGVHTGELILFAIILSTRTEDSQGTSLIYR